jgi:hypothetical protein
VQLLAKVLNDEIDLIVSHDLLSCCHLATQLGSTHENRAVRDGTAPRINPTRLPMGGLQNRPPIAEMVLACFDPQWPKLKIGGNLALKLAVFEQLTCDWRGK